MASQAFNLSSQGAAESSTVTIGSGGVTMTTPIAEYYAWASSNGNAPISINAGQDPFAYTAPTGFLIWG